MDQIVDITQDGRHLSRERGFLIVSDSGVAVARLPLDQIAAVLVHAHGVSYSNNLLIALADQGSPLVLCASNHQPRAVLLSLQGHHAQSARMRAQWDAPKPLIKQAWKQVVIAKIAMQAAALEAVGAPRAPLDMIARKVQSGDSTNAEAHAARLYWPALMGAEFRRDTQQGDINSLLNYGYTVLRAATIRAVVGAGLHPTIGLFHSNRSNAFALADDLMEPFRPLVDLTARAISRHYGPTLTATAKSSLAALLALDLPLSGETSPVSISLNRLAFSLAASFEARRPALALPQPPDALTLAGLGQ